MALHSRDQCLHYSTILAPNSSIRSDTVPDTVHGVSSNSGIRRVHTLMCTGVGVLLLLLLQLVMMMPVTPPSTRISSGVLANLSAHRTKCMSLSNRWSIVEKCAIVYTAWLNVRGGTVSSEREWINRSCKVMFCWPVSPIHPISPGYMLHQSPVCVEINWRVKILVDQTFREYIITYNVYFIWTQWRSQVFSSKGGIFQSAKNELSHHNQ